jgi:hypothetical protein
MQKRVCRDEVVRSLWEPFAKTLTGELRPCKVDVPKT